MDADTVSDMVRAAIAGAEVVVEGAGANYTVTVISEVFADLRAVKKQQLVYAALGDAIASGDIHAVTIRTFTPEEWQATDA